MQNGYVAINLSWRPSGQFSLANRRHYQHNVRVDGVQAVKHRTKAPQGLGDSVLQWKQDILEDMY